MDNQNQEENYGNPNYGNINQNDEDISYPQQLPMEQGEYDQNNQETMPPIYAEKIESVKETSEHQVKYFEPIEISSEEDVSKYLQSGQLMKTIAPKINALKRETQGGGDPSVQVQFELTQNAAIYNNQEGNEENNQESQPPQNNNLNATSPYMNNKYSLGQQGNNDMSKTQQFSEVGPNGIKYSSVLPPKFANTKVITIDQYGNRHEDNNGDDDLDDPNDNEDNQNQEELQRQQYECQLEQQKLEQEQLELQKQQMELMKQKQIEEQRYKEMQLEQQRLQQQQLEQQRLQQQQLELQRIQLQQRMQQQQQFEAKKKLKNWFQQSKRVNVRVKTKFLRIQRNNKNPRSVDSSGVSSCGSDRTRTYDTPGMNRKAYPLSFVFASL